MRLWVQIRTVKISRCSRLQSHNKSCKDLWALYTSSSVSSLYSRSQTYRKSNIVEAEAQNHVNQLV